MALTFTATASDRADPAVAHRVRGGETLSAGVCARSVLVYLRQVLDY